MRRFVAIALSSSIMLHMMPLLASPEVRGPRATRVQTPAPSGVITGTAQSPAGQVLPRYTIQVRNLQTGQLAGSTTSSSTGGFSFAGLSPANYVVEVIDQAGAVVGSSAPIAVVAGATATVTVAATAASIGVAAGAAGGAVSTVLVVTAVAAAAGIAGIVVVVRNDASPVQ